MKKNIKIILFLILLGLFFIFVAPAKASCPLCILGAVSIFGLCWWLKIDPLIIGFYLGGLFIFSLIAILTWLEKKKINFKWRNLTISMLFYFLLFLILAEFNLINLSFNQLCTSNKLLLGIILGSLILLLALLSQKFIRKIANQTANPLKIVSYLIIFLIILFAIYWLAIKYICGL